MVQRLEGKTALVTGATSNIGRAIAVALADEGARVVVAGRDRERGAAVAARTGGVFIAADLDGTRAASERLADAAGEVDILVNNAGIYPPATTLTLDEDTADRILAVNIKAPLFLTAAIAPRMAARGDGAIINLGSLYAATKGALETLTRAWAAEFGPSGVRVNAISPGVVHEPGRQPGDVLMAGTPAGTYGSPEAIGAAAVYLAHADFVHGVVLDVDGGRTTVAVAQSAS